MVERKILFVDDEESQRDVMGRVLKKMGYAVTLCAGAEDALLVLEKESFPLIITDIKMPGMDGITFCKRVRETNSETILYALSGYIESFEAEHLETAGFDGYLRKPVTSKMLKKAVEGAFDRFRQVYGHQQPPMFQQECSPIS